MPSDRYKQLITGFSGALKGLSLYPVDHPQTGKHLQALTCCLSDMLAQTPRLRIGILQNTLFVDDVLFADDFPAAETLCRLFQTHEIPGLEFLPGLTEPEVRQLLHIMGQQHAPDASFGEHLTRCDIRHIRVLPAGDEDENNRQNTRKVFGRALKVVNHIFNDVRMGRIPSSTEAQKVVRDMVRITLADPHALLALSMLKNYDNYTFTHSVNVSVLALAIGRASGLPEEQLRILGFGGLLHDIGKLKIDLTIINKPGRLTEREYREIKKHPQLGVEILDSMAGISPESRAIVLGHHVHFDRRGYPDKALIEGPFDLIDMTTIADTYDAVTTLRPYQGPTTPRNAIKELLRMSGTMLHPTYLERFIFSLGSYPVGTLVRLDSNEIGLVGQVGIENPDAVQLKILFDRNGSRLEEPPILNLAAHEKKRIVAEVDPFIKGVEVVDYF
jgi:putative nucleotidyltransferase with HDIG domain